MVTNQTNPNLGKLTSTGLDQLFFMTFDAPMRPEYVAASDSLVYNQDTSTQASETIEELVGVGPLEKRGSELAKAATGNPREKNLITYIHDEFAKGIELSKNLQADDKFSSVAKMIKSLAMNARISMDKNAMGVYLRGLAGTETIGDGKALFANDHPIDGGTVDNLITAVAGEAALTEANVALLNQKNPDGEVGGHLASFLLTQPADFARWSRILKSELRPGTANNDMNFYSSAYGIVLKMSQFLGTAVTGGSDNYWVLGSNNHGVIRWERQGIATRHIPGSIRENKSDWYDVDYRQSVGAASYMGLVGSIGTTGTKDA
jgi:hypothetical protein